MAGLAPPVPLDCFYSCLVSPVSGFPFLLPSIPESSSSNKFNVPIVMFVLLHTKKYYIQFYKLNIIFVKNVLNTKYFK